jgi:hypothetical protein
MTEFIPPQEFIKFTDYIIKVSHQNDHLFFNIFTLFIQFLLPFNDVASCKANVNMEYTADTIKYKEYDKYFKSLFAYYNLLQLIHQLQGDTVAFIGELNALSLQDPDNTALPTEGQTQSQLLESTLQKRTLLIEDINKLFIQIQQNDDLLEKAIADFKDNSLLCNDLHSHLLIHNFKFSFDHLATLCSNHMIDNTLFIDIESLVDDNPEVLIKKYILIMCASFTDSTLFLKAKFWVISQLFIRL